MPSLHVHLHTPPQNPAHWQDFQASLPASVHLTTGPALPAEPRYHILIAGRPSEAQLTASPNLRAVIIPWAGVPESTRHLLMKYPHIALHNLHHNAAPTAESALALLLAAAKFIVPFDQALRTGDWRPRYNPTPAILLAGKTALVLGYGAIGQRVGHYCHALGMRVLAVRRQPQAVDDFAEVYALSALPDLLPQSDVVVVTLPLTDATRGLLGEPELQALPAGSVLVNVGRGPVVDEAALYQALKDGPLAAAGLDVWYRYPKEETDRRNTRPSDYPFHELENVVLSPHRGGSVRESERLRLQALAEMLTAAANNQPMPNRVDITQGY